MTDTERALADLLKHATPEPPHRIRVTDLGLSESPEPRHRLGHRNWIAPVAAVFAVAATIVVTVFAVAGLGSHRETPSIEPAVSAAPSVPASTASAPAKAAIAGVPGTLRVGVNGPAAWRLTATTLTWTQNAGRDWAKVNLPAGVKPADIIDITAAAGRGIWLSTKDGPAVRVYRQLTGLAGWTTIRLVPVKPPAMNVEATSFNSMLTLSPGGVVSVVSGWDFTGITSYDRLFVSDDDGASYTQHPFNFGFHIWTVAFSDARHGLIIAGPISNDLYRTVDGGLSWQQAAIPLADNVGNQNTFDPPLVLGPARYLLPVTIPDADGGDTVRLYRSSDGGSTFTATGSPLHVPASRNAGSVSPALLANTIWVPSIGDTYQSGDGGATWRAIPTDTSVNAMLLTGPSSAIGVSGNLNCAYSECGALVITVDGGRTWKPL